MKPQSNQSAFSLAVDTTSRDLCVAIACGTEIIYSRKDDSGLQQSQRLFPLIEEGLQAAKISFETIENFLVVTGPGSFTGLRAGIASVQGLARSVGKKEFGINTFDALVYAAKITNQPVAIILNASRGDVYFGVRTVTEDDRISLNLPDSILRLEDLPLKIKELNIRFGVSTMQGIELNLALEFSLVDASTINLAEVVAGKAVSISAQSQYENALPYYLRLSDAEVNLKAIN